jgi:bifunctional UDP-N-acetylglucosamine pyrophosphorylase / glucosamine-1-phosphate N-acetyltransferase
MRAESPDLHAVILAAGKGTRMKSQLPKVLHRIAGEPMIRYVLRTAASLQPATTTLVVGHMAEEVKAALANVSGLRFVVQEPQLGTAHALLQTEPLFSGVDGTLLMLSGDVPLLRAETLRRLVERHRTARAAATLITAHLEAPYGYGRIVRSGDGITRIVEERDASPDQRGILEINAGIYAFDLGPLFGALRSIAAANAQREYYLPDLVSIYAQLGLKVDSLQVNEPSGIRGINSRLELAQVGGIVRQLKNEELMAAGVTLEDPVTTYIDSEVTVGPDTIIHPGVTLQGQTTIGAGCEIHSGVRIVNSTLDDRVTVNNFCVINGAHLASGSTVGPFAHLRPETRLGENTRIGNFVELKKTVMGTGAKANHLAYLGDATIGERVNVGAGTITCNYDGERKHQTIIEDGAFIGSDSQLVAPVKVGRGAYVAAGSSITKDVPSGALGIARGRQTNVEGWVERKKKRAEKTETQEA